MNRNPKFEFQGLDHIALVCSDMVATVDFYHHRLGMPILHTLEYFDDKGELIGQHWFFGVGDSSNPDAHIAMFWWKNGYQSITSSDMPVMPKVSNPRARPIGAMLHLDLRVDPDRIEEYCEKLTKEGIDYRHIVRYQDASLPHGMRGTVSENKYMRPREGALMDSVYFFDPDGIQIEFNAWMPEWRAWPNDAVARS
ncbi:VOC family protein [Paraburkholderia panacisoli]|uniref:VOC family protein n=1 Tax=Paraburkholderia panacisoli TaxID=2603818 RepID=A0A5B0G6H2_9BURK|nr:VOC family protein [Paraburkholderia panacisoli]KAA0999143.1 VOC family protein [Paraburkholderia panacisoli]